MNGIISSVLCVCVLFQPVAETLVKEELVDRAAEITIPGRVVYLTHTTEVIQRLWN